MPLLRWSTEGPISRLTLSQPEKLNCLSEDSAREFAAAVRALARERSRVLILSGEGKAFSAGGDLGFIEANRRRPAGRLPGIMRRFYGSFLAIRALPQVTIARVDGAAIGAGLCLALACDLRAVLAEARLAFNFTKLGLNPGMAAWPLARAAFGEARAKELLFLGRDFTGAQLAAWGGASVCEGSRESLAAATQELAEELARRSPVSLRLLKEETRLSDRLEPFLRFEAAGQAKSFKAADIGEGLAALREKRPPRYL